MNPAASLTARHPKVTTFSVIVIISAVMAGGAQYLFFPGIEIHDNQPETIFLPDYGIGIRFATPHKLYSGSTFTSKLEVVHTKEHSKSLPPNYELGASLETQDLGVDLQPSFFHFPLLVERQSQNSDITVTSNDFHFLNLNIYAINTGSSSFNDSTLLSSRTITLTVLPSWTDRLQAASICFIPFLLLSLLIRVGIIRKREKLQRLKEKVEQAQIRAQDEPQKSKYAWDAARINLEAYFERNRLQVAQVFVIAIVVMTVGFVLVCIGVVLAMRNPKELTPPLVAGISGIITQFIGATFMVIYRSTMTQANEFMVILERINTVGMSIQVLELIPESEIALKNESRAKIVELLLKANVPIKVKKNKSAAV